MSPLWLGALRDAGLLDRVGLLVVGRLDEESVQILDDPVLSPLNRRMPFCPQDMLPGLYAACDFVAIPSLFDGMPNVLLEAMASGAVPIVSDAGAMGDIIENGRTGFLFPAEDRSLAAKAAAQALSLTDTELEAMSERVKRFVEQEFTIERELDALCDVLLREDITILSQSDKEGV